MLAAILHAHPDLRGRVLDLSPTTTAATARFTAAGLDDRASAVSGSFFEPLPVGADAYLLSDILHDWDDDHARKILSGSRQPAVARSNSGCGLSAFHGPLWGSMSRAHERDACPPHDGAGPA